MLPIVIGQNIKLMIAGSSFGFVFYWKDQEQLERNCGGFLRGHASQISRILMTTNQDLFFSLGTNDFTLIEWKIQEIEEFQDVFIQEDKVPPILNQQIEDQIIMHDENLFRELKFCEFHNNISDKVKDQFILFRSTNQKLLNTLMANENLFTEEVSLIKQRAPPISIKLEFVFGFAAYDKRNTLAYVHIRNFLHTHKKKKKKSSRKKTLQKDLENSSKEFQFCLQNIIFKNKKVSKSKLIKYNEIHENCQRNFIYFVSRVIILYNPSQNTQRFYQGHKYKVTCFSLHPSKTVIASGESALDPHIHVWNVLNTEPVKILKTYHKNGILDLSFSFEGSLILSLGIDQSYSIQITNWQNEEIIAFRNSGKYPIFGMMINPYNKYEFATCGCQNVSLWKISGRNLIKKFYIKIKDVGILNNPIIVSCLTYINYELSNQIQSDIICGNSRGDLAVISDNQYTIVHKEAHSKQINCIKVTEVYKERIIIISSGEDEYIRIWDNKFALINQIHLRKTGKLDDVPLSKNLSAQSIDVYSCRNSSKSNEKEEEYDEKPLMLIGTRNGDILEAVFTLEDELTSMIEKRISKKYTSKQITQREIEEIEAQLKEQKNKELEKYENFSFTYDLYLRSHCSQMMNLQQKTNIYNKKLFFTLHPNLPIMVSVGEDQNLCLWDTEICKLLTWKILGVTPTACKFSPDGLFLVIGFINGHLMFLDSKMSKLKLGKYGDKFSLPSLEVLMTIKEKNDNKIPILSMEFSNKGQMLAVSYDNTKSGNDQFDSKLEKEGSYISVFVSKTSQKNNKFINKDKNIYNKISDIRLPSIYETYQTDSNMYGKAVYFITFSSDENYLLIYYQIVDNNQIRLNYDVNGIFIVWDLSTNQAVLNKDLIKQKEWSKLNFPNSVNCKYQFYSQDDFNDLINQNSQLSVPIMTSMLNINEDYLIFGSTNGDLHFVRSFCLQPMDKDFKIEEILKNYMCLSKSYSAHASFVNQVEIDNENKNNFYTSGILDEAIMKWKLTIEKQHWDLDYMDSKGEEESSNDLISLEKFNFFLDEIFPLRREIHEIEKKIDEANQPEYELVLSNLIGRKSGDFKNNLKYDMEERVIYIAGNNLVITNFQLQILENEQKKPRDSSFHSQISEEDYSKQEKTRFYQEFLNLDEENSQSVFPEISTFELSHDYKFLAAGTLENTAAIIIWEICSKTCINSIKFEECIAITHIKFAYDSRHLCCMGLSKDYKQNIYLIDSHNTKILGYTNFYFSPAFKYKDIEFFPHSIYKFACCGMQSLTIFSYKGGILSYSSLQIDIPKDLQRKESEDNESEEMKYDQDDNKPEEDDENII